MFRPSYNQNFCVLRLALVLIFDAEEAVGVVVNLAAISNVDRVPARAQGAVGIAHCTWLKLKVVGKGYEHDQTADLLGPKRSVTATCYAQLVYVAPGGEFPYGRYTAPLICERHWPVTVWCTLRRMGRPERR